MLNRKGGVRAVGLLGPNGSGKTALLEALLAAAGSTERQVGDLSPEAKARGQSVELNIASFDFMGDRYTVIDFPGSVEFSADGDYAIPALDLALVVVDPDPGKALLLQPYLKALEDAGVPHALFINKIDQARTQIQDLIAALQPGSKLPLVARQIPILENDQVSGFVDLALERAFAYKRGGASDRIDIPDDLKDAEAQARFHMLEQLADFDDELMEQLLSDLTPPPSLVFGDLERETAEGLITPVFLGSAQNGFGVRRLLKALRHETPDVSAAAARLGGEGASSYVFKTSHAGQAGKIAYARVLSGLLPDGGELTRPGGERARASGISVPLGKGARKLTVGEPGDVVTVGKLETVHAGELVSADGRARQARYRPEARRPVYAVAIAAKDQKDDVRLSGALAKLVEEDPGLELLHDQDTHEVLLNGQGEAHLRTTLDRLKRRYGVEVVTTKPKTPYRETIRKAATQRGRHKKQTGGHGQFGDVLLEIRPLDRGEGFSFAEKITGGAVPRHWIPAVEQGVRDALERGSLGFPVVDVGVVLVDGGYHAVDSSEFAFRAAGRLGVNEALPNCHPVLLEPIDKLAILAPSSATSKITSAISARRGQILGFDTREGWVGWDRIEVYLPQSERHDLIQELRSLTQGLATYEAAPDHLTELSGRLADEVAQQSRASV